MNNEDTNPNNQSGQISPVPENKAMGDNEPTDLPSAPISKDIEELQLDPRFDEFLRLYSTHMIDKQVNPYFKNGTQSVIRAYGLDPKTQYGYAKRFASKLKTKSNVLAQKILEAKGVSYVEFIELAAQKMLTTNNPTWWDRIGEVTAWKPKDAPVIQQTNNQVNVYQIEGKEVKDFNKDFLRFLEGS